MTEEFYTVGAADTDITPPPGVPYLGWHPHRHAPFSSVHDPLYARALYVSDGQSDAIIVSLDLIGLSARIAHRGGRLFDEVRQAAAEGGKVAEDRVLLACSHVHSAPETLDIRPFPHDNPDALGWLDVLVRQVRAASAHARGNTFLARLHIERGRVPGVSLNRAGEPWLDDELTILTFESDGDRKICLLNFACHPTIVQAQPQISADFIGAMCASLKNLLPGVEAALFLQGACGDISPVGDTTYDFRDVEDLGIALAYEAVKCRAIGRLRQRWPKSLPASAFFDDRVAGAPAGAQPAVVRCVRRTVLLPSRPLPDAEHCRNAERELARLRRASVGATDGKAKQRIADEIGGLEETLLRVAQGDAPLSASLSVLRLGKAALCGVPGEMACELGMKFKAARPGLAVVPVGYADGYLGYICPRSFWEAGRYETLCRPWGIVGPDAFDLILSNVVEMLTAAADPGTSKNG